MKFFAFISLLAAVLLGVTVQYHLQPEKVPGKRVPAFLKTYHQKVKASFDKPENANILFSFITGNKNGISPHTKNAFKKVNLSFLFSPSGAHLSGFLLFITYFLKKIKFKWIRKTSLIGFLSTAFLLTSIESIKRLLVLKIFFQIKFLAKIKLSLEHIFLLTFLISFIIGDFKNSPLSFCYSFIFLGTFFSLRDYSKFILIMGLFSTQLIIGLFMGEKVSLMAIPAGLIGSFIFSIIFPFLLIFLASFWFIPVNWAEPIIKLFVLLVKITSRLLTGTFTSSSIFLIGAVWVLFLVKGWRRKCAALCCLVFLHTNTAMTPVIFTTNLPLSIQKMATRQS